jgi:hypothetical protein
LNRSARFVSKPEIVCSNVLVRDGAKGLTVSLLCASIVETAAIWFCVRGQSPIFSVRKPRKSWCFCYIRPHFRREALEAVGGWDPFNVTEDADLGIRLARHGYRVDTITRPTYEDAPETFSNWLPQRTRWFKGWMQTWLVHMRHPRRLWRDLGPASFLTTQILCAGMVVSSIAHPVFIGSLFYICLVFIWHETIGPMQSAILTIDAVNVTLGYLTFLLLGVRTLLLKEKISLWITILLTPVYWILISLASWRALWKLYREPYHWEKTYHPRRARSASRPMAGRTAAPPEFSPSPGISAPRR